MSVFALFLFSFSGFLWEDIRVLDGFCTFMMIYMSKRHEDWAGHSAAFWVDFYFDFYCYFFIASTSIYI